MPRVARTKSTTGLYHIMLRGVNRQKIFLDHDDRQRYLETLFRYKKESGCKLYAYSLMGNHVHLLVQEGEGEIARFMKKIGVSYVYWYNDKYKRVGHLFQDRYRSETVEDDSYLLVVVRYIHQNALKAGIIKSLGEYEWCSYNNYINAENELVETGFILNLFHADRVKALELFRVFMQQSNEDQCLEDREIVKKNWTDEELLLMICNVSGVKDYELFFRTEKTGRDEVLRKLREKGVTVKRISEITGLGRSIIERAVVR